MTQRKSRLMPLAALILAICVGFAVYFPAAFSAKADEGTTSPDSGETETVALVAYTGSYEADGDTYRLHAEFTAKVGETGEDLSAQKGKILLNLVALSEIADSTVVVSENDTDTVTVTVPASVLKTDVIKGNYLTFQVGFAGSSGNTVEREMYFRYRETVTGDALGERVYRSDDPDKYNGVTVTSVSSIGVQSQNVVFTVYFSDMIVDRFIHDFQCIDFKWMKQNFGSSGTTDSIPYTDEELDMYKKFGLLGEDDPEALVYKVQFGGEKFQNLEKFPGNNHGQDIIDMTPKDEVDGISLYNLRQIMESIPDKTTSEGVHNYQNLCMQVHFGDNYMKFVFKGDTTAGTQYNTAFDVTEKVALRLKAGLMLPNGSMLKEDYTFSYDPAKSIWTVPGAQNEVHEDVTLTNQEGIMDSEWIEKTVKVEEQVPAGCGSVATASAVPVAVTLVAAVFGTLVVSKKRNNARGEK